MSRFFVFHPFLFAVFPILFLFANNIEEVHATDLLFTLFVAVVGTLILLAITTRATKSLQKAAVITSSFLALFYSYGHISELLSSPQSESLTSATHHWFLEAIWLLLFTVVVLLVVRVRRSLLTLTKLLGITAASLVLISLFNIGSYTVKAMNQEQMTLNGEDDGLTVNASNKLPDIYYIILDAYARADTLQDIYGHDNSEFINFLTDSGFYVASRSRSNYSETRLSVASSLNMVYPDILQDGTLDVTDSSQLSRMIVDNEVSRLLKSAGYRYVFVSSGWMLKDMNKYADVYSYAYDLGWGSVKIRISSFVEHLIRSTALGPLADSLITAEGRNSVLYAFDALSAVIETKGPKFVFAHVTSPHPPWYFDSTGSRPVPPSPTSSTSLPVNGAFNVPPSWYDKEGYVEQLVFATHKIQTIIETILSESDIAPIIVIQSDHGPWTYPYEDGVSSEELIERQIAEKMKILNAFYLPGEGDYPLYQSITPVNSFRVILNHSFGTDYDILSEESYFVEVGNPRSIVPVPPE